MIFDFHNETDNPREAFSGSMPTGPAKRLGMAAMRGGVNMANTALFAAAALREDPEPLFRLHDEVIEPARKYWTPDEPSTSKAMQYLEALAELPLQAVGGPATVAASTVMNRAEGLVDAGVDPMTAVGVGTFEGVVTAATMGIPAAGKTIRQTVALAGTNPVIGGAAAQASKSILEAKGYDEQAKVYDPFDWTARGIDLTLGLVFGGVAHYAKVKERLPVEMADAIDTVANDQKVRNASPFDHTADPGAAEVHLEAYGKALESVSEGKPVDVSPILQRKKVTGEAPARETEAEAAVVREGEAPVRETAGSVMDRVELPFRTELHPEEAKFRGMVAKEAAGMAEEFAAIEGRVVPQRTMPPHQGVEPWAMTREELLQARDGLRSW